jgi:hypothetical protein
MTPDQEYELLTTVKKTGWKMDTLVSDDLTKGAVPELKADHDLLKAKVMDQFSYWKGAIAVVAFLMLVFGSVLAVHLLGGK